MPRGVSEDQQAFAKDVFRDLLERFPNQTELAKRIGIDQSRVSAIRNTGKTSMQTLIRAAVLAGRTLQDFGRAVGVELPSASAPGSPMVDPPVGTFLMKLRRLPGLEKWVEAHPEKFSISQLAKGMALYDDVRPASRSDGEPFNGWGAFLEDAVSGRLTQPLPGAVEEVERIELAQMAPEARRRLKAPAEKVSRVIVRKRAPAEATKR